MGLLEIPRQSDKIISRIEHGRTNWIWFSQRECNHENKILNQFRNGKNLTGKDGLLAPLIKNDGTFSRLRLGIPLRSMSKDIKIWENIFNLEKRRIEFMKL